MPARRRQKRPGPQGNAAMSFDEIADALGIPLGTVCSAYKTGMSKLKRRKKWFLILLELAKSKDQVEV